MDIEIELLGAILATLIAMVIPTMIIARNSRNSLATLEKFNEQLNELASCLDGIQVELRNWQKISSPPASRPLAPRRPSA